MEKYPNSKTDLFPLVWRQLTAVIFREKGTAFTGYFNSGERYVGIWWRWGRYIELGAIVVDVDEFGLRRRW